MMLNNACEHYFFALKYHYFFVQNYVKKQYLYGRLLKHLLVGEASFD